jgi:hypothetical protein
MKIINTKLRYANFYDWLMMIIGTVGAIGSGAAFPFMMYLFTGIIDSFTSYNQFNNNCFGNNTSNDTNNGTGPPAFDLIGKTTEQAIQLTLLGLGTTVLSYFQVAFWMMPAERQARIIRKKLFTSILKQ